MIITRILNRHICSTSGPNRLKLVENAAYKRLFLENPLNFVAVKNARNYSAYEGDGKTVAVVINKKGSNALFINKFLPEGFILPSGAHFVGSLLIFPHTIMSWHVSEAKNVTEESLVLFKLMEPKIDILVFGYGNRRDYTPEVKENFAKCCKSLGLRFEALPTDQAVGTYNFLAEERRLVAAALIPPRFIDVLKFDRKKPLFLEDGEEDEEDKDVKIIGDSTPEKKMLK